MPRQEATHAIDVKHVLRPRAAVDKAGIKLLGDYLINGFTKNWVDIGGQKKQSLSDGRMRSGALPQAILHSLCTISLGHHSVLIKEGNAC